MPYSTVSYTGDGSTTDFIITWNYLDTDHITVKVDDVLTTDGGSLYEFSLVNSTTVRVVKTSDSSAVAAGKTIELLRSTPITSRAVTFAEGSALRTVDLNKNSDFLLYGMQEALDTIDVTSQNAAEGASTAAANSAAAALVSENAAAASESVASAKEVLTNADTIATAADVVSTNADVVTTNADAATATTKAGEASASATSASGSASTATNKASEALSSASAALVSQNAAAASLDTFQDIYLGAASSDPSTDLDGNALVEGTLYWNSTSDLLKAYNGSSWDNAQGIQGIQGIQGDAGTNAAEDAIKFGGATKAEAVTGGVDITGELTTTGNVGIGKVPPTDAHATWSQLFLGEKGSYISEQSNSGGIYGNFVTDNLYLDADTGSFANITTDESSAYRQEGGVHHWYSQASGTSGATVTLSEKMRLDASGNVGIGTSSPSTKIDAIGSTSSSSGIVDTLRLRNTGTTAEDGAKIQFTAGTSTSGAGIGSGGVALNSADLRFYSGGNTERMRLDASGNVGIGTASIDANSQLHIKKSGANAKVTLECDESHDAYINFSGVTSEMSLGYNATDDAFIIANAADGLTSNERMRVDSSGNVDISSGNLTVSGNVDGRDVSADGTKLDGIASGATSYSANQAVDTTSSPTFDTVNLSTADFGEWDIYENSGYLYFQYNGTNRMRLDNSGNLVVAGNVTAYGSI